MRKPASLFLGAFLTLRRNTTKRMLVVAAVSLGVLGPVAARVWNTNAAAQPTGESKRPALPVRSRRIALTDELTLTREFTGRIEAVRQSQLSFERGGLLMRVLVDEGDQVATGHPVAELDVEPLALQHRQLCAEHAAAQARLAEVEAGPRQERIAAARALLCERSARVNFWERERRRISSLFESSAASDKELQDTATEYSAAVALRDAARAELNELEAGTRQEQIDAQRATVAQLAAAVAQIELDIEKSTLRAPFSGSVSARYADEGLVVSAGYPVLEIMESEHLQARVGVAFDLAGDLSVGQRHPIVLNGTTADAVIARILPQLDDATRTVTVLFDLPGDGAFAGKPGQTIRLRLADRRRQQGFWLPIDALVRGERGLWAVYAVVSSSNEAANSTSRVGTLERREVEILYTESDRVYVRGLLQDGDEIVSAGAHRVVPGQTVAPLGEDD